MNNTNNLKAVVAGHVCLDITPVFPQNNATLSDVMVPGRLTNVGVSDIHTGGAVSNTGLAMQFFGADTVLMGKIGDDDFGKIVRDRYHAHGIADSMIVSSDSTSYSVVLAVPGSDRIFLHHTGANDTFCFDDLDFSKIADAKLFHFGYPPLMRSMYADGGSELLRIFQKVDELGVVTSLDMAAVDANSPAGRADWEGILSRVLPHVDLFLPSVEELCYMLDRERYADWLQRANGKDVTRFISVSRDIAPLGEKLLQMGAKVGLIKSGAPGLYYCTAGTDAIAKIEKKLGFALEGFADRSGFERSYEAECVRSGTGAGDTSIAAFLTAVLKGYSFDTCVQLAVGAGTCCVSAYDALSGLLPFDAMLKKMEAGWPKENIPVIE